MAKVLVVEDDLRPKMTYDIVLKKEGHIVDRAINGFEALEKMKSFQPDLVLLDMMMPRMTGIQFLEAADLPTNYPGTEVIVFGNMSMPVEMDRAYELGATKYMVKSSTSTMPPRPFIVRRAQYHPGTDLRAEDATEQLHRDGVGNEWRKPLIRDALR